MSKILDDCGDSSECKSTYANYDGWSMGAAVRLPYTNIFDSYENFGACWDSYCFGAWFMYDYDAQRYYSTEITFKYSGTVTDKKPRIPPRPHVSFIEFY